MWKGRHSSAINFLEQIQFLRPQYATADKCSENKWRRMWRSSWYARHQVADDVMARKSAWIQNEYFICVRSLVFFLTFSIWCNASLQQKLFSSSSNLPECGLASIFEIKFYFTQLQAPLKNQRLKLKDQTDIDKKNRGKCIENDEKIRWSFFRFIFNAMK